MSLNKNDFEHLQKIMNENPRNREVLQKLLDSHHYTISKISHEIRNPLALVYSTLQLIESQHPETTEFKYWKEMRGDIEFMTQLLQELSNFNNSEHLHKTEFSSYEFLSRVCLSFAASCADSRISFSSKIPEHLPVIHADRLKLQEVLLNLLKNAKESITETGSIMLQATSDEDKLILEISDTGCGIPVEHLETIFDAFVTHKTEGTGLGLAIVKRTIQAHGGEISISSTPEKGTTFTIKIPTI